MTKKLKGAIYGLAVGDALGVPYEFKQRGTFNCTEMTGWGTWNQPPGTWSDDTSMTLATCDSIRRCGKIDPEDIMHRFHLWRDHNIYTARGYVFDIGATTEKALYNYNNGIEPLKCGLNDEFSNGNGSLMRILPLAFVENFKIKDVSNVSSLTHAHPTSTHSCIFYVMVADLLINEIPIQRFASFDDLVLKHESEIKSTGYVVDTFNAALWCFLTTDNYKDCVLKAVNLGGDTDTIAAVAGGLAGIKYGYDSIPKEWIEQLANKDLIDSCLF